MYGDSFLSKQKIKELTWTQTKPQFIRYSETIENPYRWPFVREWIPLTKG